MLSSLVTLTLLTYCFSQDKNNKCGRFIILGKRSIYSQILYLVRPGSECSLSPIKDMRLGEMPVDLNP